MGARLARQLKLMKSTIVGECVPGTCGEPSRDLTTNTFQLNAHGRFLDTSAFLVRDMGTGARINDGVVLHGVRRQAGRGRMRRHRCRRVAWDRIHRMLGDGRQAGRDTGRRQEVGRGLIANFIVSKKTRHHGRLGLLRRTTLLKLGLLGLHLIRILPTLVRRMRRWVWAAHACARLAGVAVSTASTSTSTSTTTSTTSTATAAGLTAVTTAVGGWVGHGAKSCVPCGTGAGQGVSR